MDAILTSEQQNSPERPMLAIVGPTASGKTSVAARVAKAVGGEIITCDSVQVYRGFEIGCAKATLDEQRAVRHHLLDVVDWHQPFDAQQYQQHARAAITETRSRGAEPIISGGTGLYLRALRFGLADAPPADPVLRAKLMRQEQEDTGSLYRRLLELDAESAARIEPRNTVHVCRALEIIEQTGKKASEVRRGHGFLQQQVAIRPIGLRWKTSELRDRIERRSDAMVEAGLIDEVEQLLARGVSASSRPMRAVGYKQACEVVLGSASPENLAERIAAATWQYARRQRTWFKREPDIEWVDCGEGREVVGELVRQWAP